MKWFKTYLSYRHNEYNNHYALRVWPVADSYYLKYSHRENSVIKHHSCRTGKFSRKAYYAIYELVKILIKPPFPIFSRILSFRAFCHLFVLWNTHPVYTVLVRFILSCTSVLRYKSTQPPSRLWISSQSIHVVSTYRVHEGVALKCARSGRRTRCRNRASNGIQYSLIYEQPETRGCTVRATDRKNRKRAQSWRDTAMKTYE